MANGKIETLSEALSYMELSKNFTQEDYKKNFRRLSRKYHPDISKYDSEEDFKKLMTSKEFIDDAYATGILKFIDATFELEKKEMLKTKYSTLREFSKFLFMPTLMKVESLYHKCEDACDRTSFNKAVAEYDNFVAGIYRGMEKDFKTENGIAIVYKFNLNYYTDIFDFRRQLESNLIVYKSTLYAKFRAVINDYSLRENFGLIEQDIKDLIEQVIEAIEKQGTKTSERYAAYLMREIEKLFTWAEEIQKRKQVLENFKNEVKAANSLSLMLRIEQLEEELANDKFYDFLANLQLELDAIVGDNYCCDIYNSILEKSSAKLKELGFDDKRVPIILDILKGVTNILSLNATGLISYDNMSLLDNISFEDLEEDCKYLRTITNECNLGEVINPTHMYVSKDATGVVNYAKSTGFSLVSYYVDGNKSERNVGNVSEISSEYTSIVKFLVAGEFIGRKSYCGKFQEISVLYKLDDLYLVIMDGRFCIVDEYLASLSKTDNSLDVYKDKKYTLNAVRNSVKNK